MCCSLHRFALFFFNDTATTEIYTLSLHDALPISAFAGGDATSFRQYQLPEALMDMSTTCAAFTPAMPTSPPPARLPSTHLRHRSKIMAAAALKPLYTSASLTKAIPAAAPVRSCDA